MATPNAIKYPALRNADQAVLRVIIEDSEFKYQTGASLSIAGVKEGTWTVECDTDENKVEGYIDDLYSKPTKANGKVTSGKLHFDQLVAIVGAKVVESAPVGTFVWCDIEADGFNPYFMLLLLSKYVAGINTKARGIVTTYACKVGSFGFTLGQDGYAEVEFDWEGKFTAFAFNGKGRLLSGSASKDAGELDDHLVYLPSRQVLPLWAPDDATNFTGRTTDGDIIMERAYKSDAEGDYLEWTRSLGAGTNILTFFCQTGTDRGKVGVKLNGALVGVVDLYAESPADNYKAQVSLTVATSGPQTIRLEIIEANASASDDIVEISSAEIAHAGASAVSVLNTLPNPANTVTQIPAFQYSSASGTPAVIDPATNAGEKVQIEGLAEWIEHQATLEPGTYAIEAFLGKAADFGSLTFAIDGTAVGVVDGYSASTLTPAVVVVPSTFVVKTRLRVTLRVTVTSKNVASTGFKAMFAWVGFYRTITTAEIQYGESGPTELELLPWHADTQTGWAGSGDTVIRNWKYVSDGTINRELIWTKTLLLKGTWRARLAAEIEAGGAAMELHFDGEKVADLPLAGSANVDGRVEATFEISATTLAGLSLKNPSTTVATVYYLYLERVG